jgi:hypothetical protein
MKSPDLLFWFLLIAGTYFGLVAYWLAAVALFGPSVERARLTYAIRPVGSTALGLVLLLPVLALGKAVPGPLNLLLAAVLGVLLVLSLVGSAGLADKIGAGLPMPGDAAQPWRRVFRGGAVLGLLFVVPGLGWFGMLPLTLASGLGAFLLSRWTTPPLSVPGPSAIVGSTTQG